MRLTRSICVMMPIVAAACSNGLTAPPNELPVTLSIIEPAGGGLPSQSIAGAGDSVQAVVVSLGGVCGAAPTAAAGLRANKLVMTITTVVADRPCLEIAAFQIYAITAREVPPGTRVALVDLHIVNGKTATDSVLISKSITLP